MIMFAEGAVVIGTQGEVIAWHLPEGRTHSSIPDSREHWLTLYENKDRVLGVAHMHPGCGEPRPSDTDVTSFSAIEAGLGKRLKWWIATENCINEWSWEGPGPYDYSVDETRLSEYSNIWHPTTLIDVYLERDLPYPPQWLKELRLLCSNSK